jgi:hypothetical protein
LPKKGKDSQQDYQENKAYYLDREAKPENLKKRVVRAQARTTAIKEGRLKGKSDAREVDHTTPLSKGGGNGKGNTKIMTASANRSKHNKTS